MTSLSPLGVIAGAGALPLLAAEACRRAGRPVFVISLLPSEAIQPELRALHGRCVSLPIGAVGKALRTLKQQGVQDLLFAGGIRKPGFISLIPDAGGVRLLTRLRSLRAQGDDSVLTAVMRFFEEEGFRVLRAEEVIPDVLLPAGAVTSSMPSEATLRSVELAMEALRALGRFDVGQAAVAEHGVILGIEGPEGTDALLARCAALRRERNGLVLVKLPKPGQDRRADLPALGARTVKLLAQYGYEGVAAEAGGALFLERDVALFEAERAGVFIYGTERPDVPFVA